MKSVSSLSYIVLLITSLILLKITGSEVIFPFYYHKYNSIKENSISLDSISGKDYLKTFYTKMTTSINVGTPSQMLDLYISMDDKYTYIGKGYCESSSLSSYRPEKSNSYSNNSWYDYPFGDLRNMTIGKDKCSIYDDFYLKSNLTIDNLQLLYGSLINSDFNNNKDIQICGILGLKLNLLQEYSSSIKTFKEINSVLKENGAINSTIWTIEFFSDAFKKNNKINFDGCLILGAEDKDYLTARNINRDINLDYHYTSSLSGSMEWMLSFNDIYYTNKSNDRVKISKFLSGEIFIDFDYISVTEEYFSSIKKDFFNDYILKGICRVIKLKEFYLRNQFITCDKKKFTLSEQKKFPSLFLFHRGYNYTFELSYQDLFTESKYDTSKIIFSAIYDPWNPDYFKFGKSFLKKYQFFFNIDSKQLAFVNLAKKIDGGEGEGPGDDRGSDKKNENSEGREGKTNNKGTLSKIIWIIILGILAIGILIGIIIGKKVWERRKKRVNELQDEDDYDYAPANEESQKEKDIIN